MLDWLSRNAIGLGSFVGALAFLWSIVQFVLVRRREQQARDFQAYHRVIKELVSPDPGSESTRLDRQVAGIFELRHFPRYFEVSERILSGLQETWSSHQRLLAEIALTRKFMRGWGRGFARLSEPDLGGASDQR